MFWIPPDATIRYPMANLMFSWPIFFARLGGMATAIWTALLFLSMARSLLTVFSRCLPRRGRSFWFTFLDCHKDLHIEAGGLTQNNQLSQLVEVRSPIKIYQDHSRPMSLETTTCLSIQCKNAKEKPWSSTPLCTLWAIALVQFLACCRKMWRS